MRAYLTRLRENEPLQLILWPVLGAITTILVARGVIGDDMASVITAVAVAVLGGSGVIAARSQVTPAGHLPDAVAAAGVGAIERLRGQVADTLGQPGVDVLDQIQIMMAAAPPPQTGRR
ncbi:hypothetical protein [Nocardia sp. NPDC057030]|uniref:hypothetical protein n=1 Tax=unclassified Nocardia TaxID=2637762 RepID=UPI003635708F